MMYRFCLYLFFLTLFSLDGGELKICRFRDNKQGAVSLTFDDGTRDHLHRALPLLKKYGFRGTFYIITSRVAKKVRDPKSMRGTLSWEEIRLLHEAGHEIGNHSLTHYRLITEKDPQKLRNEINGPLAIFQEKLGITPETFCYPGNASSQEIEKIVLERHLGASRWRFSCGGKKFTVEKWNRELEKIAKRKIDRAMLFHSVISTSGYAAFPDETMFEACLQSLKERESQLWVNTYAEVCRYKLLRTGASVKILSRNADGITAELQVRPLKPVNGTLTVCYTGKDIVEVQQNNIKLPLKRTEAGMLFDAAPGRFYLKKKAE